MKHNKAVEEFFTRLERAGYVVIEDRHGVAFYPCRYESAAEADDEFRYLLWSELEEEIGEDEVEIQNNHTPPMTAGEVNEQMRNPCSP